MARPRPWLLPLVALAVGGCSLLAPSDDELLGGSGGGGASSGGAAGGGGSSAGGTSAGGSAGVPSGGSAGTISSGGAGGSGGASGGAGGTGAGGSGGTAASGGSGGTVCSPTSGDATPLPRATYVFLDRSGSMADLNKFAFASAGINEFSTSAKASGLDFGLQYFGLETGGTCAGGGYGTPAVGFGTLPGLSTQVASSLAGTTIGGQTVLEGTFNGGKNAGTQYLATKPTTQFDVVIITDVTPITAGGGCSSNNSVLTAILSSAWPAIATHFIALPSSGKAFIDGFAAAGGTVSSQSATTAATLRAALERAVTPCRFAVPAGKTVAQISLTLSTANTDTQLPLQNTPAGCTGNGWFEHAGSMALCPATCAALAADPTAKITYTASCN